MTTIKKTIAAALAALTLVGASASVSPASAKFNGGSFLGGLIGGLVIGALASHASDGSDHHGGEYRPVYRPAPEPVAVPVATCPYGTHLGQYGHNCWTNN